MDDLNTREQILIVDDEPDLMLLLSSNFASSGFKVLQAKNGLEAVSMMQKQRPALVILDLMLPGMSGIEVCRKVKTDRLIAHIPIIMVTSRNEEIDRIVGFELGLDDYVTKPFSPRELILRAKAVLRRVNEKGTISRKLEMSGIHLDRRMTTAEVNGERILLTATEFKLLSVLMERVGQVQDRDTLLRDVWGYETSMDTRTVDTHIRRLREKLGAADTCIETVRGHGYCFYDRVHAG